MGDVIPIGAARRVTPGDEKFTFDEVRVALTAFAIWLGHATGSSPSPTELVDRFFETTT